MSEKSYDKPVKKFLILLFLLTASPLMLSLAFRSLKTFKDMPKVLIAYGLLVVALILILYTVYFGFKAFQTVLNYLFDN
ncbi:conserved protein of unknown function [Tenacibaculum sp. 190524A05c]